MMQYRPRVGIARLLNRVLRPHRAHWATCIATVPVCPKIQFMAWYRKAAEQLDAEAQCALGFAYDQGDGVLRDFVIACMWWNMAAAQGEKTQG